MVQYTIRVIGERKGLDKVLPRLWKILGIEKDDVEITEGEDGNITVTLSLNPDNFKNPGQAKKMLIIKDNKSATETDNQTAVSEQNRGGKENPSKNNGDNKIIREKNTDNILIREIKVQMSVMMKHPASQMEKRISKRVPYIPFFAYKKILAL